jgi:hypothetical protein
MVENTSEIFDKGVFANRRTTPRFNFFSVELSKFKEIYSAFSATKLLTVVGKVSRKKRHLKSL